MDGQRGNERAEGRAIKGAERRRERERVLEESCVKRDRKTERENLTTVCLIDGRKRKDGGRY